jgi:hypothetical protein
MNILFMKQGGDIFNTMKNIEIHQLQPLDE